MIGIIDYGSGNVFAIANLYKRLDIPYMVSNEHRELRKAEKLILPGVGAFDETMDKLNRSGLTGLLNELVIEKQTPVLGVCVGMQIMADSSEEGTLQGFGWIKGNVRKIDVSLFQHKPHLPHMGWNAIRPKNDSTLLKDIDCEKGFYFLHSYYFDCTAENDVLASSVYGREFACMVQHGNVYGVQFHPEKSHMNGIQLFKNYAKLI